MRRPLNDIYDFVQKFIVVVTIYEIAYKIAAYAQPVNMQEWFLAVLHCVTLPVSCSQLVMRKGRSMSRVAPGLVG